MLGAVFRVRTTAKPWLARATCWLSCVATLSCGARTPLFLSEPESSTPIAAAGSASVTPTTCAGTLTCVTRDFADPCGPAHLGSPICDDARQWRCPNGAWSYQRDSGAECRPLHDGAVAFSKVSGSLSRVPSDDGRCMWIAEEVLLSSGEKMQNVGFYPDPRAPFGACPSSVAFVGGGGPTPLVRSSDGSADPTVLVQVTGGFLRNGGARVTYRLFRQDPSATFGVTELGTGLGYWDNQSARILVSAQARFATDLDFGNASLVEGDYAYLWGCNAPGHFLTEGCLLGRLDARDGVELYTGADHWSANAAAASGAIVFDDGPWISSVQQSAIAATDLLHVFASGFGDQLQLQHAHRAEGPWGEATPLAACTLPAADAKAYCAGPILHPELADPTRPGELVVSYGVATTDPVGTGKPEDYWSELAWLKQ